MTTNQKAKADAMAPTDQAAELAKRDIFALWWAMRRVRLNEGLQAFKGHALGEGVWRWPLRDGETAQGHYPGQPAQFAGCASQRPSVLASCQSTVTTRRKLVQTSTSDWPQGSPRAWHSRTRRTPRFFRYP